MTSFKLFLEAREIPVNDIFDLYYIWFHNIKNEPIAQQRLIEIKEDYLIRFRKLLIEQLDKYISRGRIDQGVSTDYMAGLPNEKVFDAIATEMKRTYRSDMVRRNEVWDFICEKLAKLSYTSEPQQIIDNINAVNMAIHNTKTPVLDKLWNGRELLDALNRCTNSGRNTRSFENFVSSDLKDLTDH